MRHFNFQIVGLDDLSNSIADLWTAVSYARNGATYRLNPAAMPIFSGVECFAVPSDHVTDFKMCYSRMLAYLRLPAVFWH